MQEKGGTIAWMGLAATLTLVGCAGTPDQGPTAEQGPGAAQAAEETAAGPGEGQAAADAEARGLGEGASAEASGLEGEEAKAEPAVTEPEEHRVHFAFDSASLTDEGRELVRAHADYLKAHPDIEVVLEGHADERGSREYNLALGERRAKSVRRILLVHGVDSARLEVVSYGEERPLRDAATEAAYQQNRRVKLAY
jgi:peptidoglycan-associated lipoprotein